MHKPLAILNVPQAESIQSIALMLNSVGYHTKPVGTQIAGWLRRHVSCPQHIKAAPGGATVAELQQCSLYVTIRPGYLPQLREHLPDNVRLLWFEINGGLPGKVLKRKHKQRSLQVTTPYVGANRWYANDSPLLPTGPRYVCYPPYADAARYTSTNRGSPTNSPLCLVNAPERWGHGCAVKPLRAVGVQFWGRGTQNGYLPHRQVPSTLQAALCYVHVKSRDCPGYSLYQAMLTGCPVVVSDAFLWNTRYTDLYQDEMTCLVARGEGKKDRLVESYIACINSLQDSALNRRIGQAGKQRLLELMWCSNRDAEGFQAFLERHL